jgi:UDPglucose--hexose-1-phosphate uridylyltransferase
VETEQEEEKRVVSENDTFFALSPYAARFPFETWILPKAHEMAFEDITDEERTPFARILKDVLGRLRGILDDPPFNYYIHTAPTDRKETKYHWHLEITPRLTETAGFERGTGFYINPVMPEDAAAILRAEGDLARSDGREEAVYPALASLYRSAYAFADARHDRSRDIARRWKSRHPPRRR